MDKAVLGEDIILKSKGQQRYSYCYIADAVSGLRCWRTVHIREIYSLICKACSHGKPWLLCYLAKTQLTFLAHFVILKLHIWESSLTVRLSNPHMKK